MNKVFYSNNSKHDLNMFYLNPFNIGNFFHLPV